MKRIVILFLLFSGLLSAQAVELKGIILNQLNQPLQFANVRITDSDIGTITDSDGRFELSGRFNQDSQVRISFIGYKSIALPVSVFETGKVKTIYLESELITSQTVLVTGSIGKEGVTPMSFSKIDRRDIEESYVNQDIPEMLSYLPSTTFYSEGGAGVGYNYLSIRGFDQRRISVAINGIPQNEPEDHNVYWVDFPDLLASTELIQVQRGAGAGVIGYPSIGGAINIITSPFSDKPKMDVDVKAGSFNTRKYTASFSSGLIDGKYSVYAKLGHVLSDGYRDYNWIDFKSYHLSAVRYDEKFTTQINLFGGPIADGLTYTGLPKFAVKDKDLRRANYSYWEAENGEYLYTLERRKDEIENFSQPHYELLNEYKMNDDVTINSALFLIVGDGFFDYDGSWSVYYDDYFRLNENGYDSEKVPANALIRAKVENHQWGWIPRVSINHSSGNLVAGAELRFHNSLHWGAVNYAENLPAGVTKDYKYYQYEGGADNINAYVHELYNVNDDLNILAELQLAYHKYSLSNEKYVGTEFELDNLALNPRFGLNYKLNSELSGYFSFARVTRVPRLKNYYDAAESSGGEVPQFKLNSDGSYNFDEPLVNPEVMNSFELGLNYSKSSYSGSVNLFYMIFNDEIVKNGQLDRFGQPVTGNIDGTIHSGIEVTASAKLGKIFDFTINGAYSRNYISEGSDYISGDNSIDLKDNRISGFPDVTFNAILNARYKGLFVQLTGKYVGEFYSDNYDENLSTYLKQFPGFVDYTDNQVEAYFVANMLASYKFELKPVFNTVNVFVQVNNILDNLYAAYAVGKEFFPAAERYFLTGITVGL